MSEFIHLHVHSHFSLLDGLCKIPALVERTLEMGMPAVSITDHDNLFGAIKFQSECKKKGVKPIFGCTLGVRHDDDPRTYQLVVLAENLTGYRNITKLISNASVDGPGNSVVSFSRLAEMNEGLIALTGNLGGAIPQAILRGKSELADKLVKAYKASFKESSLFIELQRHPGLPEQETVNQSLVRLAKAHQLPLVATADCHYIEPEHADAHAVLMCVGLERRVDLEDLKGLPVRDLYLKNPDEMCKLFADLPEALQNTVAIADRCNVEIPLGEVFLPQYEVPEEHSLSSYLEELSLKGLDTRFEEISAQGHDLDRESYHRRLEHELSMINSMGYAGYFLIVWDFILFAKSNDIPVGPGRGSGAGSLVAYCLRITDVDPLQYGLLFERFLNPERVSLPDFDIDFCVKKRGQVIDYVTQRYGEENVGQIITFGQMKARACIRDVSRVLNLPYSEADTLAKLIPSELGITLDRAYRQEPRLREAIASEPRLGNLFELAKTIEGTNRNAGIHAAGIVISDNPLSDYVPVTRGVNGELVTQFAKDEVEKAGLVKFDFLGLKNLTVIADTVNLVNAELNGETPPLVIDDIPLDDPDVYRLLSSGETAGVFQMESTGFQELMRKLRPSCFEDIIAAGAIYRPGPLGSGMVDDFCDCKHGKKAPKYPHACLKPILEETYGVIVYQEQVMQIAQEMAGYSLGSADLLRRAMGKKKPEVMAEQRQIFLEGSEKRQISRSISGEVFDNMAFFAGYGFNKSHSTAYGLITYQTAYLKTHHPVHFMAALLTNDADKTERIVRLINEAKGMNIQIRPPDINASDLNFSVREGQIRFGLGAVKGLGHSAVEAIIDARNEALFIDLFDFCERVDLHRVNRRVVETLVKCGAFDTLATEDINTEDLLSLGQWRARLFATVSSAFSLGQKAQSDRDAGQSSLDLFSTSSGEARTVRYRVADTWSDKVLLEAEKECLGFYVSGHPLDRYEDELNIYATHNTLSLERAAEKTAVKIGGVISTIRERRSKKGNGRHAFVALEDRHGQAEILVFSRVYATMEPIIKSGQPLLIHGSVRVEGDEEPRDRKVVCNKVQPLLDARLESVGRVTVSLDAEALTEQLAKQLHNVLKDHTGSCPTFLNLQVGFAGEAHFTLPPDLSVTPTDELLSAVEQLLGQGSVSLA